MDILHKGSRGKESYLGEVHSILFGELIGRAERGTATKKNRTQSLKTRGTTFQDVRIYYGFTSLSNDLMGTNVLILFFLYS